MPPAALLLLLHHLAAPPCGQNRVFVDLGANDGQSLRWFQANLLMSATQQQQQPYTSVVAFEMNPAFRPALQTLLKSLPGPGELIGAAAWIADGTMRANMQLPGSRTGEKHGMIYNMTASSLMATDGMPLNRHQGRQKKAAKEGHEASVSVPTIDLAGWLQKRYCAADRVEIKMDIEGAEFEVLEHLLRSGRATLVDSISVEWHTSKRGTKKALQALRKRQQDIVAGLARAKAKLVEWKL